MTLERIDRIVGALADAAGASAAIALLDSADVAARSKVRSLLQRLAAAPANGIARVLGVRPQFRH